MLARGYTMYGTNARGEHLHPEERTLLRLIARALCDLHGLQIISRLRSEGPSTKANTEVSRSHATGQDRTTLNKEHRFRWPIKLELRPKRLFLSGRLAGASACDRHRWVLYLGTSLSHRLCASFSSIDRLGRRARAYQL